MLDEGILKTQEYWQVGMEKMIESGQLSVSIFHYLAEKNSTVRSHMDMPEVMNPCVMSIISCIINNF